MRKTWTLEETQKVVDLLAESMNIDTMSIYQQIDHPEFLKVATFHISSYEIKKLADENLSVSLFGENHYIESYISKLYD